MREIKIVPSITQRDKILEKYFNDINSLKETNPLSNEEEIELTHQIKSGNQKAIDKLCMANLRFVISVAKQYQNQGLSLPDLINEGNIGLVKAATRFDDTKGFRFISYAVWWIRQSILQAIADQANTIRLPMNQVGYINKIKKITHQLEQEFNREPTEEEIIKQCNNIPRERAEIAIKNLKNKTISLDIPVLEDSEEITLADVVSDNSFPVPDNDLMIESLKFEIKRSLSTIPKKRREVIELFFGLSGKEPMTTEEIARITNSTYEAVRQTKHEAIRQLKNNFRRKNLVGYL